MDNDLISRYQDAKKLDFDGDALLVAISALRTQQEAEKNEPLTLDELREMDGEPVWIVENTEHWAIVNGFGIEGIYLLSHENADDYEYFGLYGKTWMAFRQKPEEGAV